MLISEVVRLSGLSKDGVRHYESLGLIRSTPKDAGSRTYRDYAPDVIETIEHVRRAQELGLSLKEIVPILETFYQNPPSREQTVEFLGERLAVIRAKLAQLRTIEAFIEAKLTRYGVSPEGMNRAMSS